jgi:hypothetical protein
MLKLMITTKEKKTYKINRFNKNHYKEIKINDYNKTKETCVKLTVSIKIIIRKHVKINDHKKNEETHVKLTLMVFNTKKKVQRKQIKTIIKK